MRGSLKLALLAGLLASSATFAQVSTLSNPPGGTGTISSLTQLPTINNNTILGNNTGGASTPVALTNAQAKTVLSIANTDVSGLGTASTAATGTSGHTLPYLDGTNTFSGATSTFADISANGLSLTSDAARTFIIGRFSAGSPNSYVVPSNVSTALVLRGPDNADRIAISNSATTFSTNSIVVGAATVFNSSGVLQAAGFPALTGDVTNSAGSLGTAISANAVSYAKFQQVAANSIVGNPTGSLANGQGITLAGGLGFSGTTLTAAGALTPTSVASTGAISGTTVAASSSILSSGATAGVGYATGAGGAVTQLTSRTTGVTNNKACGAITMFSAAGSATWATFVVTDSAVAATDVVVTSVKSATNLYLLSVTGVGAGTFNLSFATTGGTATDAPVINYCVVKGVAA